MNAYLTLSKTAAQATSTWTGYNTTPSIGYTVPTWDYDSIVVTVPADMAGAIFNGCTLTLNRNTASGTAYVRFSDTKEDVTSARILSRLRKGDSKFTMQFGFKASGYTGGIGDHSSVARWWGTAYGQPIRIAVDYTPAGAVNGTIAAGASSIFYSVKQTSLQLAERGNLTLAIKPSAAATALKMDIRPHGQADYKTLNFNLSAAANAQTTITTTLLLTGLDMSARVAKADFRFTLTTSAGTQTSSWTTTALTLVRERLAPDISSTWTDDTNVQTRFGAYVQTKSIPRVTISVTLDTEADPDITATARLLSFAGKTYTTGNNVFVLDTIDTAGVESYTISVTDSHGLTGNVVGSVDIFEYTPPRLTLLSVERYVTRQTESGATYDDLDDDGTHVWVSLTGEVSSIAGKNAWRVGLEYGAVQRDLLTGTDGTSITRERDKTLIPEEFSELTEHALTITISDEFEGSRYAVTLPKAGAILSVEAGGVGIGKRCTASKEAPQLQVAYPAVFDSTLVCQAYSTAEIPVGRWINGATVYRKVVSVASVSVDSAHATSISLGIRPTRVINVAGFVKTTSYGDLPVNCYHSAAIRTFARPNGLTGNLTVYAGTSCANTGAVYIVDYLKN